LPTDLLLPLFGLTLLANAVLVAAAIRSLRRGGGDPRPGWPDRPVVAPTATPSATSAPTPAVDPAPGQAAVRPTPVPRPVPAPTATAPETPAPAPELAPMPAPEAAAEPIRRTSPPADATASAMAAGLQSRAPAGGESRRRGRRRFSLPPMDEDHDKVSRSIETFLGGVESDTADVPAPRLDDAVAETDAETEAIARIGGRGTAGLQTIALVAVAGITAPEAIVVPRRNRRATRPRHADPEIEEALALVERTLRGAARGTDVVSVGAGGVFRVDLPATGELAARAYLRRVRATVEPVLEASHVPLRLAVATATVLDEPIRDALRRAELRLVAAMTAVRPADPTGSDDLAGDGGSPEPRAAGD
jgi:hypothetical protein